MEKIEGLTSESPTLRGLLKDSSNGFSSGIFWVETVRTEAALLRSLWAAKAAIAAVTAE